MKIAITIKTSSDPGSTELDFSLMVDGPTPVPINGLTVKFRRVFDLQKICARKFLYCETKTIRNGAIQLNLDEKDWIFSCDYVGFLRFAEHFLEAIGKE